jgi:protein-tyrosine phosphatase
MPGSAFLQDRGSEIWALTSKLSLAGETEVLVSLIEAFEFEVLRVSELPEKTRNLGITWLHLPIVDVGIPDWEFEVQWDTAGRELRKVLVNGGRIVLHCRGGLGRTGMIAARLLVEFGMEPNVRQLLSVTASPAGRHSDQGAGGVRS